MVGDLLRGGAEVGATDGDGWTALHFAAEGGHRAVVGDLLRGGAEVGTTNGEGHTATEVAERKGHEEIAQVPRMSRGSNTKCCLVS